LWGLLFLVDVVLPPSFLCHCASLASGDSGLDRETVLWASFFFSGESCVGRILSKRLEVETRENGVGGSESQGVSVGGFPADHHNHGHRTASRQLQAAEEGG